MPTASQQQPLHIVYALVVVYALCYQLQSPIEPFLVAQLSARLHPVRGHEHAHT